MRTFSFSWLGVGVAVGLACLATGALGADAAKLKAKARTTDKVTDKVGKGELKVEGLVMVAPFVTPALPESAFVMPKDTSMGRDPFFPKSARPYAGDTPVVKLVPTTPVADLALKGISGSKEQPLAIVNTTTFTTGEENDVLTKAGRMRIRCLEINMDAGTVLIQVGGERRELKLGTK